MNRNEDVSALRLQLDELRATLDNWRVHMAWQEEIASYAASLEELERRLFLLEKRIARELNGEPIAIRFVAVAETEAAPEPQPTALSKVPQDTVHPLAA